MKYFIEINKNEWENLFCLSGSNSGLLGKPFPLLVLFEIHKFKESNIITWTYKDFEVLAF